MSVEGTLPSARPHARHRNARLSGALAVAILALSAGCSSGPKDYVVRSKSAPGTNQIAVVRLEKCNTGFCESLAMGPTPDTVQTVVTLGTERCTEIVWSPDGKRAGFVIDGQQLHLYDAANHRPAGQIDLVARDANPPTRFARGVTFSDNGAAITFDDCAREKSGCQSRIVGLR